MEGLLCQGNKFVFYLEDNGDLLKALIWVMIWSKLGMARRLSALYWGKSLLDFTTPQQGTERGSVRIRYGKIEQKPKIKHLYLKQVWRGGQCRV